MFRRVVVLRGVLVLGVVAAAHPSAGEAQAKVDPGVTDLQARFAAFGRVRLVICRGEQMGAEARFEAHSLTIGSTPGQIRVRIAPVRPTVLSPRDDITGRSRHGTSYVPGPRFGGAP